MNNRTNHSNLDVNLSSNEIKELKLLNKKSNILRKNIKTNQDPLNMSIRKFIKTWADVNIHVLIDLTNFINDISKYKTFFDDIDDTNNFFSGINSILKELHTIVTKEHRSIFIGFTFVIISFALYIIQITS
tara:strand:- start:244 stop:636 length:393 start_codon:yes stop_codon:yes gene_type:complete